MTLQERARAERWWSSVLLVGWLAVLAAALAALTTLGRGPLAAPPLTSGGPALSRWLETRDAAGATFAVLRLAALGLGWYLLATTLAAVILRLVRAGRAAAAVELATLSSVRRLVHGATGFSLAVSIATSSPAAAFGQARQADQAGAPVTMRRLPDEDASSTPTMRRLQENGEEGGAPITMRRLESRAAEAEAAAAPDANGPIVWTVRPGDSLWRIAKESLTSAWSRRPTDAEITPFWREVVEQNRPALSGNVDLIFPGQRLTVPPRPPAP